MMIDRNISLLMGDKDTRETFERIVEQRRVQLRRLEDQVHLPREELESKLKDLINEGLIDAKKVVLPDYTVYYVTSKGLEVNRKYA